MYFYFTKYNKNTLDILFFEIMSQTLLVCMNDIICYVDNETYYKLAKIEDIELFKLIYSFSSKNKALNKNIMGAAIYYANLDIMKFLLTNGYQWNGDEWFIAIEHNNINVLAYLLQNNCPMSSCCEYCTQILQNKRI